MDGARTRGQATALAAVAAMVRGPAPQAVILVGPEGVGKTTLAVDLRTIEAHEVANPRLVSTSYDIPSFVNIFSISFEISSFPCAGY